MQRPMLEEKHKEWSKVQANLLETEGLQDVCRCEPVAVSNGSEYWPTIQEWHESVYDSGAVLGRRHPASISPSVTVVACQYHRGS